MTDVLNPQQRSKCMSRIRNKNTTPELVVRSLVHRMGFRFRLHRKDLPGNPDMVLPCYRKIIFVNGCFWHHHRNCKYATMPSTRRKFWENKLFGNIVRDKKNIYTLKRMDWLVLTVWECEIKNNYDNLVNKIERFLY